MYKIEFILTAICLFITTRNVNSFNYKRCNVTECPRGPIRFYEDMYCQPIYKNKGDCCPIEYDCSKVYAFELSEHCYLNNKIYKIGEKVKEQDLGRDEKNCYCEKENLFNTTEIVCKDKRCPEVKIPTEKYCYKKYTTKLCSNKVECPKDPLTCEVNNNQIIMEGEKFVPDDFPLKDCICQAETSEGERTSTTFCYNTKNACHSEFYFRRMLIEKQAPLYDSDADIFPQKYCPVNAKIYEEGDSIILPKKASTIDTGNCTFGPLLLPLNARLNKYNYKKNEFSCALCKCRIPPVLTCQKMPLAECEEKFENFKNNNPDYQEELKNCKLINKDLF